MSRAAGAWCGRHLRPPKTDESSARHPGRGVRPRKASRRSGRGVCARKAGRSATNPRSRTGRSVVQYMQGRSVHVVLRDSRDAPWRGGTQYIRAGRGDVGSVGCCPGRGPLWERLAMKRPSPVDVRARRSDAWLACPRRGNETRGKNLNSPETGGASHAPTTRRCSCLYTCVSEQGN